MAKSDAMSMIYAKRFSPLEFHFANLYAPPLINFFTSGDYQSLYNIATSVKYAANIEKKYKAIDDILKHRGFVKLGSGTNRVVYRYLESTGFVAKIAFDRTGLLDNPSEYTNQAFLQPFVTKVFDVSPGGVVASVERVQPITSLREFKSIAESVYDLLCNKIIGKYVLEDIGTKYFMNYGLRNGFGPVLLDFPYVYKLDGNKLYCNNIDMGDGSLCGGEIDYDAGFNQLRCKKCNKRHFARDLEDLTPDNSNKIIFNEGEEEKMKIKLIQGTNNVVYEETINESSDYIRRPVEKKKGPIGLMKSEVEEVIPAGICNIFLTRVSEEKVLERQQKGEYTDLDNDYTMTNSVGDPNTYLKNSALKSGLTHTLEAMGSEIKSKTFADTKVESNSATIEYISDTTGIDPTIIAHVDKVLNDYPDIKNTIKAMKHTNFYRWVVSTKRIQENGGDRDEINQQINFIAHNVFMRMKDGYAYSKYRVTEIIGKCIDYHKGEDLQAIRPTNKPESVEKTHDILSYNFAYVPKEEPVVDTHYTDKVKVIVTSQQLEETGEHGRVIVTSGKLEQVKEQPKEEVEQPKEEVEQPKEEVVEEKTYNNLFNSEPIVITDEVAEVLYEQQLKEEEEKQRDQEEEQEENEVDEDNNEDNDELPLDESSAKY